MRPLLKDDLMMAYKNIKKSSTRLFLRKALRTMLTFLTILLACLLVLFCVLLAWSPGKPASVLDGNGKRPARAISEKVRIPINGIEQGMFIKSRDSAALPVLLFLHGGPGMPEYFLTRDYPTGLEELFTVCWWDQRGAGLSFHPDIPPETLTLEQLISDTKEVTNYLRRRFGQEKIYLIAHSGGSFIGLQAAARTPELYHAYIGIAQISRQLQSEKMAYEYMLGRYKKTGNEKMRKSLEKFPIPVMDNIPSGYRGLRDKTMHDLGVGTTHEMRSVVKGVFLPSWKNPEYTLREKLGIWRGKWSPSSTRMWNEIIATDLTAKVTKLEIPLYLFHGIYDYTVTYSLAKDYFALLQAPLKGFYTFNESSHSPIFEEPEKMRRILRGDVLAGANKLADQL